MDRKYWYWINNLEGIGNVKIRTLLSLGTPEELYNMERKEFECPVSYTHLRAHETQ